MLKSWMRQLEHLRFAVTARRLFENIRTFFAVWRTAY